MANPTPLKLTPILTSRDGTSSSKDARYTNMLLEMQGDEQHFIKRPGYSVYDGTGWGSLPALGFIPLPNASIITLAGTATATGSNNATVQMSIPPVTTYATWDPNAKSAYMTLSGGNLTAASPGTQGAYGPVSVAGTQYKSSGQWYAEYKALTAAGTFVAIGIVSAADTIADGNRIGYTAANGGYIYENGGYKNHAGTQTAYGAAWVVNDIISMLYDASGGTLVYWKNGVTQGTAFTGITGAHRLVGSTNNNSGTGGSMVLNAGASAFAYTPTTGYFAWGT